MKDLRTDQFNGTDAPPEAYTLERQQHQCKCRMISLLAQLKRADPTGEEFERIEEWLFDLKSSLKVINSELSQDPASGTRKE